MSSNTASIKFGIRSKLFLPLIIGQTAIICIILFIWQPSQLNKAKAEFITEQTKVLKSLNSSIIQNILSNDLSSLHSILENSLKIHDTEWVHIKLTNSENKQLYPIFDNKVNVTDTVLEIKLSLEENDESFGQLILLTDWQLTRKSQTENINRITILLIILLGVIAALSFILQTKWIYTPITELKNITSQFANGKYETNLPGITKDEIGSLTKSIENMRNKIQLSMSELVDKEKMQRAILESAPDAIITIDRKGIIKSFNPGAENIFQYKANQVIGNNIKMLMPNEIARFHDHYLESFEATNQSRVISVSRELFGKRNDGSQFPIELTINAKIIDDEYLFTGILRDITERKKVEKLKDEFISTVSHELRTPLTAIKGSLDLITKGFNLNLPDEASTMLEVANRNVDRLLTLINDILDVSKLESGEIDFKLDDIKVLPFLNECIELNQEYAKKYNTDFVCTHQHEDITLNADKDRLIQVMSNLLSNAAKYSPENISVEIFTDVINGNLRVSVKDYGPGIPEEFQASLFQKFTQSSSGDTRQVGGTGLGLSISKTIIEKLGGSIGFNTIKGKETTFYFELPIVNAA